MVRCQAGLIHAVPAVSSAHTVPSDATATRATGRASPLSCHHVLPPSALRQMSPADVAHQRSSARPAGAWANGPLPASCQASFTYWQQTLDCELMTVTAQMDPSVPTETPAAV